MHARRGLTLIELLVTVAVMSITALLVIPSMGSTGVLRVQAAARTIVSDITLAQTEAMAFQVRRGLYFNAVADGSGGYESGNGYVVAEPTTVPLGLGNLSAYELTHPEQNGRSYTRDFSRDADRFGGAAITDADFDGVPVLYLDELGAPMRFESPTAGGDPEVLPGNGGSVTIEAPGLAVGYRVTVDTMTGRVDVTRFEIE
ncbi:MAG: prepilin-type N-terminal cleavage/methylation domain-containing protein, partial [Planctomycetota bacterium]